MTLWVNGRLVDDDAPVLRADDHGLVVGDGVFETCKVLDGVAFARTRHLRRLRASAGALQLDYDEAEVNRGIDAVVGGTRGTARLRITVTGGPSPYASTRGDGPPTVLVAASPLSAWSGTADVATVPWTRNENAATAGAKTTSYADNVVALHRAHGKGASEAIFGNTRGELCEGTGSNVFVGIGGQLVTPPLTSGCLAGITRELLLEWLGDVAEQAVPLSALAGADEAFLASSTRDIQPVRSVDGMVLAHAPGPLTRRAATVFAERSAQDPDP